MQKAVIRLDKEKDGAVSRPSLSGSNYRNRRHLQKRFYEDVELKVFKSYKWD